LQAGGHRFDPGQLHFALAAEQRHLGPPLRAFVVRDGGRGGRIGDSSSSLTTEYGSCVDRHDSIRSRREPGRVEGLVELHREMVARLVSCDEPRSRVPTRALGIQVKLERARGGCLGIERL
jgi:hypothetical protein